MKVPILLPKIFNHPFTYETNLKLRLGDYVEVPFGKTKTVGVVWDEFEKNKGAANALAISLRFGFGMIGAGCVSIMNDKTIYPYIFTVMFFSCFAMISGLKAVRNN